MRLALVRDGAWPLLDLLRALPVSLGPLERVLTMTPSAISMCITSAGLLGLALGFALGFCVGRAS